MFGKIFKKLLGKKSEKEIADEKILATLREKSSAFAKFIGGAFEACVKEITDIRQKSKNLRETNYQLGLKHIEKGNLPEAIFRFRFIKKFWPDLFDAYYQLAYCLVLNKKYLEASEVLKELLIKDPAYDPKAQEMLTHIELIIKSKQEQNFDA